MNAEKTGMFLVLSLSIATLISGTAGILLVSPVFAGEDHHDHGDEKCKNNDDNNCNDKRKSQKIEAKNDCEIENQNEDHSKENNNENNLDCANNVQNFGVSSVSQGDSGDENNLIIKLNVINDNGGTAIPSDFRVLVYLGDSTIENPNFSFPGNSDGTGLQIPLDIGIHVFFKCDNLNKCANYPTSGPEGEPGDVPEGHEVCNNDPLHTNEIRTCVITTDDPP